MKYKTILLFGAPGAGKGTQGKILGLIPNYFHFACGDAFRSLTVASPLGKVFIEHSGKGQLVPDEPTIRLWQQSIDSTKRAGRFRPETDTLILDGIPRNVRQAEMLRKTLDVKAVFYLHCQDMNKMIDRLQKRALKENRLDDANLDVIRERLKTYDLETKPVLKYYGRKLVHDIDSTQSPIEVLASILRHLVKK